MHISFIGMSNIGKSYKAKRLASESGFVCLNCDAMIEARLQPQLAAVGASGLRGMAKWMGFPSDLHYQSRSDLYLAQEKAVMYDAFSVLDASPGTSTVVDTTGSVIYAGDDILTALRKRTKIIYFEASATYVNELFKRYIANPKPTIWGGVYVPQVDEAPHQTLRRCYPELLRERAERYKAIAHITVPFEDHRNTRKTVGELIQSYMSIL